MFSLVRRSSRLSYCLLLLIALPVIFNAEYLLGLWLEDVPEHAPLFVQLFLVFALSESLSNPMITAMLATGDIRRYQLVVGGIQLLNVPVSYICLRLGAVPEVTVLVAVVISQICLFARLWMLSKATGFAVAEYIGKVYVPVLFKVTCAALLLPLLLSLVPSSGFVGFLMLASACVAGVSVAVYSFGLTADERAWLREMISKRMKRR